MLVTPTHVYFYQGPFSNWDRCIIEHPVDKVKFPTSEHAFMYQKAFFFKDEAAMQAVLDPANRHPKVVKAIGRRVKNYDDAAWENARFSFMVQVNLWKFQQSDDHRAALRKTGDRILVEASPYDTIWGVGLAEDDLDIQDQLKWKGRNLLGQSLGVVREILAQRGEL